MIYDQLKVFSSFFLTAPLIMVALTTTRNSLMIQYLLDITNIDKICDKNGQKFKFLCKLNGCEAKEGAE